MIEEDLGCALGEEGFGAGFDLLFTGFPVHMKRQAVDFLKGARTRIPAILAEALVDHAQAGENWIGPQVAVMTGLRDGVLELECSVKDIVSCHERPWLGLGRLNRLFDQQAVESGRAEILSRAQVSSQFSFGKVEQRELKLCVRLQPSGEEKQAGVNCFLTSWPCAVYPEPASRSSMGFWINSANVPMHV